jgi:hypothetical protein
MGIFRNGVALKLDISAKERRKKELKLCSNVANFDLDSSTTPSIISMFYHIEIY